MKKNRYIFALITILVCGDYAFAADASVITSVILYPGNATIERTVRVAARASRVELTGLPANFDPRSVRVEADARIHVGEVFLCADDRVVGGGMRSGTQGADGTLARCSVKRNRACNRDAECAAEK